MRMPLVASAASLAAFFALTAAPRAEACGPCADSTGSVSPAYRREPLPVNARLLFSGPDLSLETFDLELIDVATDDPIPFTLEDAGDTAGAFWLIPDELLPAGGEIALRSDEGETRYLVGTAVDETAPVAPDVELEERAMAGACCANVAVQLSAPGGADDDGQPAAVLKVVLRSAARERVVLFGYRPGVSEVLGTSEEGCVASDPDAELDVDQEAFVSVIDWAGNESEAIGPISFRYAETTPGGCRPAVPLPLECACATTTTRAPVLALVAFAGVFLLLRRRRS